MKTHTTNYFNAFIAVADDSTAAAGTIPPLKGDQKTIAKMQFDMIAQHPYAFTSDDVLFQVYADKNDLLKQEYDSARVAFFSKGQACFRASPLTKKYGWGLHSDQNGKIAIYGRETEAYKKFVNDSSLKVLKAMRSSR